MKTGRIVLFLMVLSILWCADVFAHGKGKCYDRDDGRVWYIRHFTPNGTDPSPREGEVADPSSGSSADFVNGHGHILYNDPEMKDMHQWGYWTAAGYKIAQRIERIAGSYVDCDSVGNNNGNNGFSIHVISGPGSGAPGDTLTFVVEVREGGTAASGQTVTFSVSPNNGTASLNPTSPTTDSNGRAQTILTLGDSASGSYSITATSNSKSVSRTATVTGGGGNPPPTYSIHVISGPGSGAPGSQLTFVVEVRRDETAASGQTVTFSVSPNNGTASLNPTSPTTDSNGRAQTILTLGDSASGSYSITATSNSKSVSRTATVTGGGGNPPPTYSIHVISGPGSGAPGSQLTFVVEVRRDETAASGQTVTFSVSPNNGTASLGTTSTTTGSNGRAQTILTLGDSASGSYSITATSNSKSVSRTATVTGGGGNPPPTYSIHVISGPGSGAPGSQLTFVVEVRRDETAASGQTVTFSVSPNNGTASLNPTSPTTDSNGRAQTILTLGDSASGSYSITATSNSKSVSRTATVTGGGGNPPPTYSIHVISGPGSGAPGSQLTFVVEVRRDETAASGQTVTFSVSPNNGTASLGTTSTTTGSNGRAQTILTLGDSASGSYSITATSNSKSVSRTATVTGGGGNPPPTYSIHVISGPGSGAPGSQLTFVVEVRRDETAASGQTVTFSVSPNNGTASLGTTSTTTGSNGRAQTILTLGDSASGSYSITATSNSKSVSRTATVTGGGGNPPPTYSIHVISGPGSGAPSSQLTFTVEVLQDGTLTEGLTVTFSVSPNNGTATLSPTSTTTDSNGQAQTTLTLGNSASGSYTITAMSNGVSVSGTATVETEDDNNGNGNGNGGNNQEPDIPQRTDPESDEDHHFAFQLDLDAGWNFVHIPLEVTQVDGQSMSIETLGNLFQILTPANMYIYDGTCWMEVFGDSTQGLGTTQGVAVYMDAPKTVNLVGTPLPTSFTLERGMNFVGLPRQSADLRKVSDFLAFYPKVCAVLVAVDGELYLVGRAGDSGDVEITGGQAFGIISVEQYMTSFGGAAWGKVLLE